MKRSFAIVILTASLSAVAFAEDHRGGQVGAYRRPAMAVRSARPDVVRARTVGETEDGRKHVVMARMPDRVTRFLVDKGSGEVRSFGTPLFAAERLIRADEHQRGRPIVGITWFDRVNGRTLDILSQSGRSVRLTVRLPNGEAQNRLVFTDSARVTADPGDGLPSNR